MIKKEPVKKDERHNKAKPNNKEIKQQIREILELFRKRPDLIDYIK